AIGKLQKDGFYRRVKKTILINNLREIDSVAPPIGVVDSSHRHPRVFPTQRLRVHRDQSPPLIRPSEFRLDGLTNPLQGNGGKIWIETEVLNRRGGADAKRWPHGKAGDNKL